MNKFNILELIKTHCKRKVKEIVKSHLSNLGVALTPQYGHNDASCEDGGNIVLRAKMGEILFYARRFRYRIEQIIIWKCQSVSNVSLPKTNNSILLPNNVIGRACL